MLNLARPYLIQAYRNALTHTALDRKTGPNINVAALEALGLTSREAEVLRLVAMGHSNQSAAAALGVAERTTQKHLEHSYRKLSVTNRSQASRLVWSTVR
jgi:DNA-binding CsgD family transcriptional regulator